MIAEQEIGIMEELLSTENVTRLWEKARPYAATSDRQLAGLSESVVRGMTLEELERPRPAQDAPKDVEAERAEWDRTNTADRFE
jgi:hypothetical protein